MESKKKIDLMKKSDIVKMKSKIEIIESPSNKTKDGSKNIGKYIIQADLGEGTFGKVKVGIHSITGDTVAIKVLEKSKIMEVIDKTRVEREIKLLKVLRHKNIIHLYQVIQRSSTIYLIMEFAGGKDLFSYIQNKKRLTEQEACEIFQQLISAIEYLHKFKIAHRDIKPENIILESNDKKKINVKLIDFGLSNVYKPGELLKTMCGSPCYAAPEIIIGSKYKGEAVDVWSTGITLFNMVCGFMPFSDANTDVIYKKVIEGKYNIPQFLSEGVKDLIRHMLVVDADKRFRISEIKSHPWFGIVSPSRCSEGLMINQHIIPIEEQVVTKMMNEFDFRPEDVRLNILASKHTHTTATYYLLLKRLITSGVESIADMSSKLFKDYLANPKNLLKNYNYDINILIRERCQNPPEDPEEFQVTLFNNMSSSENSKIAKDDSKTKGLLKTTFNEEYEIISGDGVRAKAFLRDCSSKLQNTLAKEKYHKFEDLMIQESSSKDESDKFINSNPSKKEDAIPKSVLKLQGICNFDEIMKYPGSGRESKAADPPNPSKMLTFKKLDLNANSKPKDIRNNDINSDSHGVLAWNSDNLSKLKQKKENARTNVIELDYFTQDSANKLQQISKNANPPLKALKIPQSLNSTHRAQNISNSNNTVIETLGKIGNSRNILNLKSAPAHKTVTALKDHNLKLESLGADSTTNTLMMKNNQNRQITESLKDQEIKEIKEYIGPFDLDSLFFFSSYIELYQELTRILSCNSVLYTKSVSLDINNCRNEILLLFAAAKDILSSMPRYACSRIQSNVLL